MVKFYSNVAWPGSFQDLCRSERTREIPVDLQAMKAEAGEGPHLAYPLRDIDSQFEVQMSRAPDIQRMGRLSYGQLMREAYPGAVYYYGANGYRVLQVRPQARLVRVRRERSYTTRPIMRPPLVYPNLTEDSVLTAKQMGDLLVVECGMQVCSLILGYKERRGPNELSFEYPLRGPVYYGNSNFRRNYFTTGVIVSHRALGRGGDLQQLAHLLYEALLLTVPFEPQDLGSAQDRFRIDRGPVKKGSRFLTVFDQTYGSLRLSSRLTDKEVIRSVLAEAIELGQHDETLTVCEATMDVLRSLARDAQSPPRNLRLGEPLLLDPPDMHRVIRPGGVGWAVNASNREFRVERPFYSPVKGLCYRGQYTDEVSGSKDVQIILEISDVIEVPGKSSMGRYNLDTGEIEDLGEG